MSAVLDREGPAPAHAELALIVDDEATNRLVLRAMLSEHGFETVEATTGAEAVEACTARTPDIIFMDVMMPIMDGYEATQRIKANPANLAVPIIFLTAVTEEPQLKHCIDVGGDDFLTKPYSRILLKAKIDAARRSRDLHRTLLRQRNELSLYQVQTQHDMETARRLLENINARIHLAARNLKYLLRPMETLNGDIILAARKPSGEQCFLVGDFTGHGLPAALGAFTAQGVFTSMATKGFPLLEIAVELNRKLNGLLPVGRFLSACLIELNHDTGLLAVCNAGMPDLVAVAPGGELESTFPSTHVPFGILPPDEFRATSTTLLMEAGDRIYAYSDGLVEAHNPEGELYGSPRLLDKLTGTPRAATFDAVVESLGLHVREAQQSDDISFLEVERLTEASRVEVADGGPQRVEKRAARWSFELELDVAALRGPDPVPAIVQTFDTVQGLAPHRTPLYAVLVELYSNALEHGILQLDSGLKHRHHGFAEYYAERQRRLETLADACVVFSCRHEPVTGGGRLELRVSHTGKGFDAAGASRELATNDGYSGRGIRLIRSLCESLEYLDGGRTAVARYRWSADSVA
ncbi:MAG: SpoIIE family protein phosphatase [Gammaproteobacteria bacterium]|nr:SpoIIE family protein phosphatase [Gammaproteobacteria bacterium]